MYQTEAMATMFHGEQHIKKGYHIGESLVFFNGCLLNNESNENAIHHVARTNMFTQKEVLSVQRTGIEKRESCELSHDK